MSTEDLKPCPICGQPVKSHEEKSPDGTITWVRITHGPTIPCGISFLDVKSDCLSKEKLQHLFASNEKTAKDFIKWAKSKNVKIHQSTISRQLSGKQGLTVAWELAYMAYFDSIKKT